MNYKNVNTLIKKMKKLDTELKMCDGYQAENLLGLIECGETKDAAMYWRNLDTFPRDQFADALALDIGKKETASILNLTWIR